jgi:hypothetical protein
MLEHLRQRVSRALSSARTVTISTYGPAGLQASRLSCRVAGIELFVLLPRTSDHLFNIEASPEVAVVNDVWSLNGLARLVPRGERLPEGVLEDEPQAAWSEVLHIHPVRLTLLNAGSPVETIDIE